MGKRRIAKPLPLDAVISLLRPGLGAIYGMYLGNIRDGIEYSVLRDAKGKNLYVALNVHLATGFAITEKELRDGSYKVTFPRKATKIAADMAELLRWTRHMRQPLKGE